VGIRCVVCYVCFMLLDSGVGCYFGVFTPDTSAQLKKPPPATRAVGLDARIADDVMGGDFVHHILVGFGGLEHLPNVFRRGWITVRITMANQRRPSLT
jgi:hypothetical protein